MSNTFNFAGENFPTTNWYSSSSEKFVKYPGDKRKKLTDRSKEEERVQEDKVFLNKERFRMMKSRLNEMRTPRDPGAATSTKPQGV